MQTKRALSILSKGKVSYSGDPVGPLAGERAEHFRNQYEAREAQIAAKKQENTFQLPFAQALQRKLSALNKRSEPDMPMATVFEVFQGVKRMAAQDHKDRGLQWLSRRLARHWAAEPEAALTSRQVSALKHHISANFGRSKAGKVLEQEIVRIGFHKLPVAKLARIASKIDSQEDYDDQIRIAGLDGEKLTQVRARTLLRSLVAMRQIDVAPEAEKDERTASERAMDAIAKVSQMDEMMAPPAPEPQEQMMEEEPHEEEGPGMKSLPSEDEAPAEPGMGEAVDIIEQVEQFVEDSAPPEAEPYIQHEMGEGHEFPPGSAGWGFEEAEEGHTAPPPSEDWQAEEIEEIKGGGPAAGGLPEHEMGPGPEMGPEEHAGSPMMGASKHAKGLDEPMPNGAEGPPQREVETYMPTPSSNGGTELKSASQIEAELLDGLTVTANGCSIRISDSDEVQLFVRGAGKACDLMYMDGAIQDFLKYASEGRKPRQFQGAFHIVRLVPVPCERCASISYFPDIKGTDAYACDCGNKIAAAGVRMLVKTGQLQKEFRIEIALPQDANKNNAMARKQQVIRTVESAMPYAALQEDEGGMVAFTVRNTDESDIRKVENKLKAMGVQQFDARRWAQMLQPQTVVHAPGTGEAQEVEPQGPAAPQPEAKPKETEINIDGPMSYDDIAAAFRHYKSTGKPFGEAVVEFRKDYKDRIGEETPEMSAQIASMGSEFWSGGGASPAEAAPVVSASKKKAEGNSSMKPKVNTQQPDAEKIEKGVLGNEGSDDRDPGTFGAPAKPKAQHPMKGTGPMSSEDMHHGGPGTDEKDPGRFKAPMPKSNGQVPGAGSSPGTSKVTDTNLGKDSDTFGKGIPTPGAISPGRSDKVIKPKK